MERTRSCSRDRIPYPQFIMKKSIFVALLGCVTSLTMVDISIAQG